jgi:hypothetical protein
MEAPIICARPWCGRPIRKPAGRRGLLDELGLDDRPRPRYCSVRCAQMHSAQRARDRKRVQKKSSI